MPKKVAQAKTPESTLVPAANKADSMFQAKKINAFLKSTFTLLKKISSTQVLVFLLVIAAFLIGVLVTKVEYLEKGQVPNNQIADIPSAQQPTQQQGLTDGQKVDVAPGELPALGEDNAKVTVIEFADFQCPFCGKWFTESGSSLIKEYVDTGKVKLYYRHFAFLGEESNWAAEASNCANDQGKFWEFHDFLFKNQQGENQGAFTKDKLKGFAANLGLNTSTFNSCLDQGKYTKAVTDDTAAGQAAGVSGTPTVFVNGQTIVGAQPYNVLKALIDQELAK